MKGFEKPISMLHGKHTKTFEKRLALSDDRILEEFSLTLEGRELSKEEAMKFLAFIRAERPCKIE
ncbi:MAG: hypothetical protein K0S39_6027 [Paenibacillus sp.]|jgi:hypothetical protein|nr:hypothetical protein [Paenibacillus sp.]